MNKQEQIKKAQEHTTPGNDLSDDAFDTIYERYKNSLPLTQQQAQHTKQFLLCPVGLIGTGKTTILTNLQKHISFVRVRTDDIRHLLMQNGYNLHRTRELAFMTVKELLADGYSIAIDADCVGDKIQEHLDDVQTHFPTLAIIWIHITANDDTIRQRLSPENTKREYTGERAIKRYELRQVLHEDISQAFDYTIDTSANDTAQQFEEMVETIQKKIS